MIIKHIINLETHINEDSNEPAVKMILDMPEETRNAFFQDAGEGMITFLLEAANQGHSWAKLQVAQS